MPVYPGALPMNEVTFRLRISTLSTIQWSRSFCMFIRCLNATKRTRSRASVRSTQLSATGEGPASRFGRAGGNAYDFSRDLGFCRMRLTPHIVESFCCYSGNTFQAPSCFLAKSHSTFGKERGSPSRPLAFLRAIACCKSRRISFSTASCVRIKNRF